MSTLPDAIDDSFTVSQALTGATVLAGNLGSNDLRSSDSSMFGWAGPGFTGYGSENGWWTWDTSNPAQARLVFIAIVQSGYVTFPQAIYAMALPTAQGGTVILNTDGTFSYTAPNGYVGVDSFDYSFVDEQFGVSQGSVTINVEHTPGANLMPVAVDDAYDIAAGQKYTSTVSVLANDSDGADGISTDDALTIQGTTFLTAKGGIVSLFANGQFTYTPKAGFVGVDSFNYTVKDGLGAKDQGLVTLNVGTTINTGPTAVDDSYAAVHGRSISGNVLANDNDINSDAMSVVAGSFTTASGGVVTILSNGEFTYEPAGLFIGQDSFDYVVADGRGGSDIGTVTIAMTNAAPDAVSDTYSIGFEQSVAGNVLVNDSDPDGDALAITAGSFMSANGGQVVLLADGAFSYVPAQGFVGADSFTYTVSDGLGGSTTALLRFNVLAPVGYSHGTTGDDDLSGGGRADVIAGLAGDDTVYGYGGHDRMYGGADRDVLLGQSGDDHLFGGDDKDTLKGGAGNDWLDGGAGADTATGGLGADRFVMHASSVLEYDRITDFQSGVDTLVIDLSEFGLDSETELSLSGPSGAPRLIYDDANKSLFLDDGLAGTANVLLTTFSRKVILTDADFDLI